MAECAHHGRAGRVAPSPFHDHTLPHRHPEPVVGAAVARVLANGRLDWGSEGPTFEAELAGRLRVPHAVGTNQGTAALNVALQFSFTTGLGLLIDGGRVTT